MYVPNSKPTLERLEERQEFDNLFREFLVDLKSKKSVMVLGDLNVGKEAIDVKDAHKKTKCNGYTQEERDGIKKLLDEGFTDSWRT